MCVDEDPGRRRLGRRLKRSLDVIGATFCLVLLAPVMVAVWLAVRFQLGSPAIFRQRRLGFRERPFYIVKYRTMTDERDRAGKLLPDDGRLTRLGRFLRSASLDELPELFNVLAGEMSLVGPRPLLPEYLPRYTPFQRRRHEVKPGITGWAQVNGRNVLSWERKFELDMWYVEHWSLCLDIKILWSTVLTVLRREGISAAGQATMSHFMGAPETCTALGPDSPQFRNAQDENVCSERIQP